MRNPSKIFVSLWMLLVIGLVAPVHVAQAYQVGDPVPVARRGQFHGQQTSWLDQLGRHCPHFGIDSEVVMPIPKPTGFSEAETYKIAFQFGREKYLTPWLLVVGRREVPLLDVTLRHSGGDLEGATVKALSMPPNYLKEHESLKQKFFNPNEWPKHILVRYTWVERSEIDVAGGLYVLFGSGFVLFLVTALYILQSSKEKLARFLKENVVETSMVGEVPKAD